MGSAPGLLVRHARLAGAGPGDGARLAAALDRVSLPALGLPPGAVLVLGRVAAPAPLKRAGSLEPFARRLEEQLRRRAAAARRGLAGGGGGDWLWQDEAALEVGVVAAWLDRTADAAALLRTVLGSGALEPRTRWRRTILPDGERAVRTLAGLAEAGLAAPWLAGFEPGEMEAAAARIRATYGGTWSAPAARPAEGVGPAAPAEPTPVRRNGVARTLRTLAPEAEAVSPRSPARLLLLTALAARRRPALLTLPGFVEAARLAAEAPGDAHRRPAPPEPLMPAPTTTNHEPSGSTGAPAPQAARLAPPPRPGQPGSPIHAGTAIPPGTAVAIHEAQTQPACHTGFGGLLFLLNAFVALGLWGDFTRPRDGLPGLSPFELLLLLGRRWYGRAFTADPLAARLRDVAGLRPGQAPGEHFAAPAWAVSPDWLAPWPGTQVPAGAAWHPAGFPLAGPAAGRTPSPATRRRFWVSALGRYLAARLAAALGMADPGAARDLACRRAGALTPGADELVLTLPLADHPLEIRLAGLDRDPGRLAGTACAVRFEFTA